MSNSGVNQEFSGKYLKYQDDYWKNFKQHTHIFLEIKKSLYKNNPGNILL